MGHLSEYLVGCLFGRGGRREEDKDGSSTFSVVYTKYGTSGSIHNQGPRTAPVTIAPT